MRHQVSFANHGGSHTLDEDMKYQSADLRLPFFVLGFLELRLWCIFHFSLPTEHMRSCKMSVVLQGYLLHLIHFPVRPLCIFPFKTEPPYSRGLTVIMLDPNTWVTVITHADFRFVLYVPRRVQVLVDHFGSVFNKHVRVNSYCIDSRESHSHYHYC